MIIPDSYALPHGLGQLPKKLGHSAYSRPARAGKDRIITHPIGHDTRWTTARSLGEVGCSSVHSKPVFACHDCAFLDGIHRAALEKKEQPESAAHMTDSRRARALRACAGSRRGRRGRPILQESVLGAADGKRRNRPGVLGVLSEVPETPMSDKPIPTNQSAIQGWAGPNLGGGRV
jgi:hypothetical protein